MPIECAHISTGSAFDEAKGGTGLKYGDDRTISLCAEHHRLSTKSIHNLGETSFARFWQIDPWRLVKEFQSASPALQRLRMRMKG